MSGTAWDCGDPVQLSVGWYLLMTDGNVNTSVCCIDIVDLVLTSILLTSIVLTSRSGGFS